MQVQYDPHVIIFKLFFVICLAEECKCNSVSSERWLYAVRYVFLIGNRILVHEILTGMLHMSLKVEISPVCNSPELTPSEREQILYVRSCI